MNMENAYVKQFPDVMKGKKLMYIHGFASSAKSGTVVKLSELLPNTTVVARDVPLDPHAAMDMLQEMTDKEQPDIIMGTSMGGMYAEMLYGHDRILVNPAFQMGETMKDHGMIGKQTFQNPREDGIQEFIVTKAMVKEYKDITEKCFAKVTEEEQSRVWGLFGDEDPLVHTHDLFANHYRNAVWFHGEHRTNDKILINSVIPVIRWIDDKQENTQRPVVLIGIDALRGNNGEQVSSAIKGLRMLIEHYNVYYVASSPNYDSSYYQSVISWLTNNVGVPSYNHLLFVNDPSTLLGDYLIDKGKKDDNFMGTYLELGSDTFKTWEELIEFFERLGGQ